MRSSHLAAMLLCGAVLAVGCEAGQQEPAGQAPARTAALASDPPKGAVGSETTHEKGIGTGYAAESYRLISQKDEIVSVLRNGLVVITKRVQSPVLSVRGYAFTGGLYEGKWVGGGVSHLLEHLVAGGSNGRRTEEQNKELLQKIGNNSNAYTSENQTVFFVNTTPDHMEQAVDLVTGWMFTAKITPDEYGREYEVVQRELEMGKGEPDRQFAYMQAKNRYRISPARVPVIGYQAVIQSLTRDDVYNYYRKAYVPNNMMFVVAGNEDPQKMLEAVQQYSEGVRPGFFFSHDIAAEPPVDSPRTLAATFPKLGEAKLSLGFPSVDLHNGDMYALDVLAAVLGQGDSSILVQDIRDNQQLVSGIEADDETPAYVTGTFNVMMQLAPEKVPQATKAVLDLLESIKKTGVDQDRIDRAKTMMRAARVRSMQTTEDIAASLGDDFLSTGDPHFQDLYVQRIERVTNDDIKRVARKYFNRSRLLTTAMFPAEFAGAKGLPKVEDLLRESSPTQQVTQKPAAENPEVQRTVLDNGTILLVKRITTSPLVSIQMYSLGGLTAEDAKTNGLGNLTMSTLVRGTTTRNAQQIAEFFDSIGGGMAASCGNNTWSWSASCLSKDFDKAFNVYADVVNNPAFPDQEVAAAKKRIEAAIAEEDANWTAQAGRYFKKEFFGPLNSPYQYLVIGTQGNVQSFTPDQMRQWYEQKVQAAPRVLAVFGDVEPDHVKELAQKLLGEGNQRPAPQHPQEPNVPPAQNSGEPSVNVTNVDVQKTEQALAGVIIGYRSDSVVGDPANYVLDVIDTLTSGYTYPTGYIFETLRGLGLVYVADAQNAPGRDAKLQGTFEAYAGCDPRNVNRVVELILENIARVEGSMKDVQADWFKRAKELIVVADAMEKETPSAQAQLSAVDEVLGLGYNYHKQFADQIRKVTFQQVQEVARARLHDCIVTVSTPHPELVTVKPGERKYASFPPVNLAPKGVQHDVGGPGK